MIENNCCCVTLHDRMPMRVSILLLIGILFSRVQLLFLNKYMCRIYCCLFPTCMQFFRIHELISLINSLIWNQTFYLLEHIYNINLNCINCFHLLSRSLMVFHINEWFKKYIKIVFFFNSSKKNYLYITVEARIKLLVLYTTRAYSLLYIIILAFI